MLFRLCHYLNEFGENAFMLANDEAAFEKTGHGLNIGKPITRKEYEAMDPAKTVAVYPEMVYGNPLDAKIVVRWLLNTPGVAGGDGKCDTDDFVFIYSDYFKTEGCAVDGKLTIYNPYLENFTDDGRPRQGTCYMIRKGWQKPLVHHPKDALLIDDYGEKGGNDYLHQCFNQFETFISYDHATLACVQAALCGCLSIVIPDGLSNAQEWRLANPMAAYGVAYGVDDVDWANLTRPLLREHLRLLEQSSMAEIKTFIKIVKCGKKSRAATNPNEQIVSKMGSTEAVHAKMEVDGDPLWVQFIASKETFEFCYRVATDVFLRGEHKIKLYYPTGRIVKVRLAVSGGEINGPLSFTLARRPGLIHLNKLEVRDADGISVASMLGEKANNLQTQGTAFLWEPRRGDIDRRNNAVIVSTGNNPILQLPDMPVIRDKNSEILIEFMHSEDMNELNLEFVAMRDLMNMTKEARGISFYKFLVLQQRFLTLLWKFVFMKKQGSLGFFKKLEKSLKKRRNELTVILRRKN
jgi:hypothetical protein